jgi:hypothetical protein
MRALPEMPSIQTVSEVIATVKNVLRARRKVDPSNWVSVKSIADQLMDFTAQRLKEIKETLESEIEHTSVRLDSDQPFFFGTVGKPGLQNLLSLTYEPNIRMYEKTQGLAIVTEKPDGSPSGAHIAINAHAIGSKFRGLIGFIALCGFDVISKAPFQTNYAESYESAERRFRPWLEESLVNALTLWRKSL